MFMRAVVSGEERSGLLVFDEPSAALDPTAEHGTSRSIEVTSLRINDHLIGNRLYLFTRIRKLREGKYVVFSSHRFGELTKPADLILYVTLT